MSRIKIGILVETDPIQTTEKFEPICYDFGPDDFEMIPPDETSMVTMMMAMFSGGVPYKPKEPVEFTATEDEKVHYSGFYIQTEDEVEVRDVEQQVCESGEKITVEPRIIMVEGDEGKKELAIP